MNVIDNLINLFEPSERRDGFEELIREMVRRDTTVLQTKSRKKVC